MSQSGISLQVPVAPKAKYTLISCATSYYDSTDLEPSTKTITATARPASADYSCTNNLAVIAETINGVAQGSSRLTVKNVGFRLIIDLDSLSSGSKLNAEVLINGQTPINAGQLTSSGAGQFLIGNLVVASTADVRALLAEIRLWKDTAGSGNTVVSKVELQIAYGVAGSSTTEVYRATINGLARCRGSLTAQGSGTISIFGDCHQVSTGTRSWGSSAITTGSGMTSASGAGAVFIHVGTRSIWMAASIATDLDYINSFGMEVLEF